MVLLNFLATGLSEVSTEIFSLNLTFSDSHPTLDLLRNLTKFFLLQNPKPRKMRQPAFFRVARILRDEAKFGEIGENSWNFSDSDPISLLIRC